MEYIIEGGRFHVVTIIYEFLKSANMHTHMFHVLPTETSDDKLFPDPRAPRAARVNNRAVQRAVHCGRDTLLH